MSLPYFEVKKCNMIVETTFRVGDLSYEILIEEKFIFIRALEYLTFSLSLLTSLLLSLFKYQNCKNADHENDINSSISFHF